MVKELETGVLMALNKHVVLGEQLDTAEIINTEQDRQTMEALQLWFRTMYQGIDKVQVFTQLSLEEKRAARARLDRIGGAIEEVFLFHAAETKETKTDEFGTNYLDKSSSKSRRRKRTSKI